MANFLYAVFWFAIGAMLVMWFHSESLDAVFKWNDKAKEFCEYVNEAWVETTEEK